MATASVCNDAHDLRFFCSNCNRFFCGECSTITHSRKGGLKDHDVEPIEERLTSEEQKGEHLIEVFTQLSDNAEAAANAKDAINEKSCEMLSGFAAHVEQLTMCSQIKWDAQFLRGLRRYNISFLQRETSLINRTNPESDPVGALASRLLMNGRLEEQIERMKKAIENAEESRELNSVEVSEAIYQAAVALIEKNSCIIYLHDLS